MNALRNLFKEVGNKDIITLFHNPSNAASMRVHALLKQTSAASQAHATEDQASDHSKQSKQERIDFSLTVQEEPPTTDQLNSILEYLGPTRSGTVVKDSTGSTDALKKFKQNNQAFQRPVTVDWSNGRAVVGDDESEILKLIRTLPK